MTDHTSGMESSDDEDVKRAIALSLGQPDPKSIKKREVIDLCDEEVVPHSHDTAKKEFADSRQKVTSNQLKPEPTNDGQNTMAILGLDRKAMEAERLARKRKAPLSPPSGDGPSRSEGTDSARSGDGQPIYPSGAARTTFVKGFPRTGNDVTLAEVLRPSALRLCVLSSFQWDMSWLFTQLRPGTRTVLVMQAKDQDTRTLYSNQTRQIKNLRLCFPDMSGMVNCMHSKLMILSYEHYLRLAIPTANLVPYDWGETGDMENSVWMIDLPRLADGRRTSKNELTFFGKELVYFLEAQGLHQEVIDSLCGFDFTATKDIAFIHTVGGANPGSRSQRTGYPGLGRAVRTLGLTTINQLSLDFVASSIGNLSSDFLSRMHRACQGQSFWQEAGDAKKKSDVGSDGPDLRIYFPTTGTVERSLAGYAGTICLNRKYFEAPTFPRHIFHDCISKRKGVLMHNKILYVRNGEGNSGKYWAYMGSHNCSESAWGNKIVKDRKTQEVKLNARNWECGVLLPCSRSLRGGGKNQGLEEIFAGTVPVPMQYPARAYGEEDGPWYFMEHD